MRPLWTMAAGLVALALSGAASVAQTWPSRPVRLLVPLAAGGGVDFMARLVAERLSEQLGQRVVVENQGGGGGTIATAAVARSAPDGYTLIFQSVSAAINPLVYKNLPYDGIDGFVPVSIVARFPLVAVVPGDLPARTLSEFIALAKAKPDAYSYGSSGVGTITHLAGEQFLALAGIKLAHVPYRGNSAVVADLIAGRVQLLFDGVAPQLGNINSGTLRALGVTTSARSSALPEVPAIKEILPGYEIPFWTGIFAPVGTPPEIVNRLSAEVATAVAHPDTARRLAELGIDGVGSSPDQAMRFWRQQIAYFKAIVDQVGVSVGDPPK